MILALCGSAKVAFTKSENGFIGDWPSREWELSVAVLLRAIADAGGTVLMASTKVSKLA